MLGYNNLDVTAVQIAGMVDVHDLSYMTTF